MKASHHRHSSRPRGLKNGLNRALAALQEAGLKRTPIRERILRHLIENHGPFSKDEIQSALPRGGIDGVTLYRNLAHFESIGLLRRSEFGDGISRYEFQADSRRHHHHIICERCRRVDSLDSCDLPDLDAHAAASGYRRIRHALEFFGICPACEKSSAARS